MKHLIVALMLLVPAAAQSQQDLLKSALGEFGLDSSRVGYKPLRTWTTAPHVDPFRLPWFDDLLAKPLKVPAFSQKMLYYYNIYATADSANMPGYHMNEVRPMAMMVVNSARNLGHDIGKYGFDYTPTMDSSDAVMREIRAIFSDYGRTMGDNIVYPLPTDDWSDIALEARMQLEKLPLPLQQALGYLLAACRESARLQVQAMRGIPLEDRRYVYENTTLEESQCDAHTFDQRVYDAAVAFDVATSSWGAAQLAQAVEKSFPVLRQYRGQDYGFDLHTPLGRVLISGGKSDIQYDANVLLHIELGGDDTYYGSAAATAPDRPVSVLIDLGGSDRYENRHKGLPSQAAGIMGVAILADLEGDDTYVSRTFSQGCGRFGVGLLYDESGSDSYESEGFAQGAGMYGIGVVFDKSGNDRYNTVYYAQGYGFSKGLGLIMDVAGNDGYVAADKELTHVGDETPKHNESDAQGFGAGRRGDHTDGHNMSGGIGILNDLAGDDTYFAGVFAQASSYWYGYGMISDASGDDRYRGVFFNLGAAAHFGIGVLLEGAGNDYSELVMTLGFGTGHDGSTAYYLDFNGDDAYELTAADGNAVSLGSSLNSSFSLFANIRGNDSYKSVGRAFGFASTRSDGEQSQYGPTLGIFIDIGGEDGYAADTMKDNTKWSPVEADQNKRVYGIAIDAIEGSIKFDSE